MKYLFKLAFSNIIRAKRRTILTFLVLAIGVMMYIMMGGMVNVFAEKSIDNLIQFDTGDFKIRSVEFEEDKPYKLSNFIENYEDVESVLDEKEYVTGYTERIAFLAEIDNFYDVLPIQVIAIDPETDTEVFNLNEFYVEGQIEPEGIVLGKKLAEDMNIYLYDWVYLTFRDSHGTITSSGFMVSGIVDTADPFVNSSTAYINMDEAQNLLAIDSVTEIAVKTEDFKEFRKYLPDLQESIPDKYEVWSWARLGEDMLKFMEADRASGGIFLMFIIIIAFVGTINTMLLSVYEKKREIGMLKALGMTDGQVQLLFLFEGLIIGLLGSILGMILGALGSLYFIYVGIDVSAWMGGDDMDIGYRVMGVIKSNWDIKVFIHALWLSVITATLGSFFPARKTTKMTPVESLRVTQ